MKVQLITDTGLVIIVDASSVYEALDKARDDGYYRIISAVMLSIKTGE